MTTPSNPPDEPQPDAPAPEQAAATPPQPAAGPPPEQAAAPESPQPDPTVAPGGPEQPPGSWMPGSWQPGSSQPGSWPPGYPPPGSPFAPVARAPRTPWVNPDRRVQVVVAAIVGALVFGGGGVLVGHALTANGHDRDGVGRVRLGPDVRPPGFGPGYRVPGPGRQRHNVPNAPTVPNPAPSGSATS